VAEPEGRSQRAADPAQGGRDAKRRPQRVPVRPLLLAALAGLFYLIYRCVPS
jgi:hypothetical protein